MRTPSPPTLATPWIYPDRIPTHRPITLALNYTGARRKRLDEVKGAMVSIYHMMRVFTLSLLSIYQWLFEITDGGFTWFLGKPVLLLRTTGAKTGIERTAALVYATDGSDLIIVASAGGSDRHPGWYFNILKHPDVSVQIGRERMRMKARVADPDERSRAWRLANENNNNRYDWYQTKTKRQIPVVVLTPL